MTISCGELLDLKYFKSIKIIAGSAGLYRPVTWPFICTTSTISEWLYGGEIIFITGAGLDICEAGMLNLLRECITKRLSGMVLVFGDDYISEIHDSLLELAEE